MSNFLASQSLPWRATGVGFDVEHIPAVHALSAAGLDWSVRTVPIVADGNSHVQVPGFRAVLRTPDEVPLGIVGDRYHVIQNSEMFSFLETILSEGTAHLDTIGQLGGGQRVWALVRLSDPLRLGQDITEKYLLLVNSHDGSTALRMLFTPIRVMCSNTLNIALARGAGDGISIRHTAAATERIHEARRVLGNALRYYQTFTAEAERLHAARFSDPDMRILAAELLPAPPNDEPSTRLLASREKMVELFTEGQGHRQIEGTGWAALNAVAEFSDHHRPSRGTSDRARADGRLSSLWFGAGAALKRRAFDLISQHVA